MRRLVFCTLFILALLFTPCFLVEHSQLQAKEFVLVIDAGHGGHDPGALGKISKEKDINLKVALKLGKLIEANCHNTKVIYTRKKDVFIPLNKRAEIANNAKADLFISIHTNALAKNKTAKGASTWTLGLAKSDANLEVAKRENAVILYENDYKTRYAGFNPNSAESYIIFEFMQDKYMEQSVHLASLVQKQFKETCKRQDRGVHQAGFLVLKASAMPSILIELGFISTPEEERFLNSEQGVQSLANSIYRAFRIYKEEQEARQKKDLKNSKQNHQTALLTKGIKKETDNKGGKETKNPTRKTVKTNDKIIFKIQFIASSKLLPLDSPLFKGLKNVAHYKENELYKYTYGETSDYEEIVKIKRSIQVKFKDAFIVAFKNNERINTNEAINDYKKKQR